MTDDTAYGYKIYGCTIRDPNHPDDGSCIVTGDVLQVCPGGSITVGDLNGTPVPDGILELRPGTRIRALAEGGFVIEPVPSAANLISLGVTSELANVDLVGPQS